MNPYRYELYYWPGIQGRGELVRLALEEAGADYLDVARQPESEGGGPGAIISMMRADLRVPPLAPPFLRHGEIFIAQTTNVLAYLGDKHDLAGKHETTRYHANQIALTVADLIAEVHDTHHPVASSLTYEQQKPEAKKRAKSFAAERIPKFLGYFERILAQNGGEHLLGAFTYADLCVMQCMLGLEYAFPNAMKRVAKSIPNLHAHTGRIAGRERIAAYLASTRRIPFNERGIFRKYPELDSD